MSDESALTMADVLDKAGPALSATSDGPVLEAEAPPLSVEVNGKPETTEEAPEAEADGEAETVETPAKPAKKGINERFSEYAAKVRNQENTIAQLTETVANLSKQQAEVKAEATADPKPSRDQYTDPDTYDSALETWGVREGERRGREAAAKEATDKAAKDAATAVETGWQARLEKARTEMPDFDEVALSDAVRITDEMALTVKNVENGPQLAYHLGKNPEEALRIAGLTPAMQIYEMGRLAASLGKEKPSVSKATKPHATLGTRASAVSKDPSEMSMDEYAAKRGPEIRQSTRRVGVFSHAGKST